MAHSSSKTTRAMRDGYPSLAADPKTGMRPGYKAAAEEAGVNHWAPRHPYEMEGRVYAQYGDLLRKGWRPVLAGEAPAPTWYLLGWIHNPQLSRLKLAADTLKTQWDNDGVVFSMFESSYALGVYDASVDDATWSLSMGVQVEQTSDDSMGKLMFHRRPPEPPRTIQIGDVSEVTYGIIHPRDLEDGLQPITTGLERYGCPDGSAGMVATVHKADGHTEYRTLPQGWGELARAVAETPLDRGMVA